jgi:methylenetetrahydrofolate--tRNA-(uracil-5-)-methyltransferase
MSGVEGYVESAASGLVAGLNAAAMAKGEPLSTPPRTTAIGALAYYVSHANPAHYEPSNITFGIMQPLDRAPKGKKLRNEALSARALADLEGWLMLRQAQHARISDPARPELVEGRAPQ